MEYKILAKIQNICYNGYTWELRGLKNGAVGMEHFIMFKVKVVNVEIK